MGNNLLGRVALAAGPRLIAAAIDAATAERQRWPLWLPVGMGTGIGVYFALPAEPQPWLGTLLLGLCLAVGLLGRRHPAAVLAAVAAGSMALGFAVVQWKSQRVAAPVLGRSTGVVTVAGRVVEYDPLPGGLRIVLDRVEISPPQSVAPERVRIRLTGATAPFRAGQRLRVRAVLNPPYAPTMPGGFDFGRQAWFEGLGAVGWALGQPQQLPDPELAGEGWGERLALGLASLRGRVTRRLLDGIGGAEGAVAAALITGEKGAIPPEVAAAYRACGMAHILAIAGLHMSMVAALVFAVVRGGLALIPAIALRYPIKKWTAAIAILFTLGYLLLAGIPISAQRAFCMSTVVLLAVLFDRKAVSLRSLAWAGIACLLWAPDALIGPSFQMSFAAVLALISFYEVVRGKLMPKREHGWILHGLMLLVGASVTNMLAGTATAPFGIFHFNRYPTYSLPANLVAVPLVGFWLMPAAILSVLTMPLGLDALPLWLLGRGIWVANVVAATLASWPRASLVVPAPPMAGLVVFSLGGLWLCLWRRRWRWLGVPVMVLAWSSAWLVPPPDLLVDGSGDLVAVRAADGRLLAAAGRGTRMVREAWASRAGDGEPPPPWDAEAEGPDSRLACDQLGCIYRAHGQMVAVARQPEALIDDCQVAGVVVAAMPVRRCASAKVVVDRFAVWREGAHALWLHPDGVEVRSVAAWRGQRPWAPRPRSRREEAEAADQDQP